MAKLKVIYKIGNPIFFYKQSQNEVGYCSEPLLDKILNMDKYNYEMDLLLDYLQNETKTEILFAFEYVFLKLVDDEFFPRSELNSNIIQEYHINGSNINSPKPSYISEYINTVGQLFLAGYIEFGMCGLQDKEENLLSKQKDDKYQAWIHFRDNFFYTGAYWDDRMDLEERYKDMSDEDYVYSNWDTPQFWDMYRFWVCRTPKGTKYFKEVLAPKFYNKYKDLEVEVDDEGKVIRWIGRINR